MEFLQNGGIRKIVFTIKIFNELKYRSGSSMLSMLSKNTYTHMYEHPKEDI